MGFRNIRLLGISLFSLCLLSLSAQAANNIQGKRFQDRGGKVQHRG